MSEKNKQIIARLWDVWRTRDLEKLGDLIAKDHILKDAIIPRALRGVEEYGEIITI